MAAMMAGFEFDFAWLLQAVMNERALKVPTTQLFRAWYFHYAGPQVCQFGTFISSILRRDMLISASSGMRSISTLPYGVLS